RIWSLADEFCREHAQASVITRGPASVDLKISAARPAQPLQFLRKYIVEGLQLPIILYAGSQPSNSLHYIGLLRACREWPRGRAANKRDELAAPHSITSAASARSESGTVRPSVLAVLRLMISSAFVACWTGRSAGFSPLRTRPV